MESGVRDKSPADSCAPSVSDERLGKYRVLAELGSGGMSRVFLAVSYGLAGFRKLVVIKVLKNEFTENAGVRTDFLREARICARMRHPNVVAVNEVGLNGRVPFIVMEYLEGQALNDILRRVLDQGPSDILLRILCESLSGLHYAHELTDFGGVPLQLVHRDFSPSNVFVTYEGSIKTLDFGIAQVARQQVTLGPSSVQGKLRYMAPEQLFGAHLDRRTDVFAAGVLLQEIVTGRRFWGDCTDAEIIVRVKAKAIPSLRDSCDACPAALMAICDKALAFEPQARYQTVEAMQRELDHYIARECRRVSTQEIGRQLARWFSPERERAQQVIESALSKEDYYSWSNTGLAPAEPTNSAASWETQAEITAVQSDNEADLEQTVLDLPRSRGATPERPASPSSRPLPRSLVLVGVLLLLCVAAALLLQRISGMVPAPQAPLQEPRRTITLKLSVRPAFATVSIDGVVLRKVLVAESLPLDNQWHDVEVRRAGYVTYRTRVKFDQDRDLTIELASEDDLPKVAEQLPLIDDVPNPVEQLPLVDDEPEPSLEQKSPAFGANAPALPRKHRDSTQPTCAPPYRIDARGIKHFKTECR